MTSAMITAPHRAELLTRPLRELSATSVRVRLQGCGVCGSNLPVWDGRPWFRYPLAPGAPGHEGWGIVEEAGEEVEDIRPGDRVAMWSFHAFAEYDTCEAEEVVTLPGILDGQPFPGEALGCAMNVFRRTKIRSGQTVAVVGIGFLGALLVSLAANAGARVIAIYRRPFTAEIARRLGASESVCMENSAHAVREVMELTRDEGCERVIEATGHQGPLDLASEICRERGRLIIAGYHQDGPRQVNMQSWNWHGLDVINAHERDPRVYRDGMQAAVDAIAGGKLDPTPLYTHCFKLSEISDALDTLTKRPPDFLKALVIHE